LVLAGRVARLPVKVWRCFCFFLKIQYALLTRIVVFSILFLPRPSSLFLRSPLGSPPPFVHRQSLSHSFRLDFSWFVLAFTPPSWLLPLVTCRSLACAPPKVSGSASCFPSCARKSLPTFFFQLFFSQGTCPPGKFCPPFSSHEQCPLPSGELQLALFNLKLLSYVPVLQRPA